MDKYERKEQYAKNKMRRNAQVEGLSSEQHDALTYLCKVRHEIHCAHEII